MKLQALLQGAKESSWGLKKLNLALGIGIPFNKAHCIKVKSVDALKVETFIPYKRRNFNHIKGTHACAIATVSEFSAGLLLMNNLHADKYRIIMRSINVEYFYQCKKDAVATSQATDTEFATIKENLLSEEKGIYKEIETQVHDSEGQHIATAKTLWQIKAWDKVKTKV